MGEEKEKEGTTKGWLIPPMFQILKNTLIKTGYIMTKNYKRIACGRTYI